MSLAILRPYAPADLAAAAEALTRAVQEAFAPLIPPHALAVLDEARMRARLGESAAATTWLVEDAGAIVGLGQIDGDEITFLYLRQSHVGRGLGMRLMERLLETARAAGLTTVRLWCLAGNSRARRLYDRLGAPTGRVKDILLAGAALPHVEYAIPVRER